MMTLLLFSLALLLSFGAVAAAHHAAVTAADLVALSGCEKADELSLANRSHIVHCIDDGVTISVETRSRINLPLRVHMLFAHAKAQAVHEL